MPRNLFPPLLTGFVCFAFLLSLAGCASQGMREDPDALYYRLGARKMVSRIAADTVAIWAADTRLVGNATLSAKIAAANSETLKRDIFEFFCWAASGPCDPREKGFEASLRAIQPTPTEWFYLLEGIVGALNKHHIPDREKNDALELIYALQYKVVGGAQNPL